MSTLLNDSKRAWIARLPDALITGRGLLVTDLTEPLDDSWCEGVAVWDPLAQDVAPAGFEIAVFPSIGEDLIEDPSVALRLLQAATTAVFERRPIVAGVIGSLNSIRQPQQRAAAPWDLDIDSLCAGEEFAYLLTARCEHLSAAGELSGDVPGSAGAAYLTPIERRVAAQLASAGIPFKAQVPIGSFRVDFLVDDRLVVECDGARWHDPGADRLRDEALHGLGYPTVRLTGRAIHADAPGCVDRVRRALGGDVPLSHSAAVRLTDAQQAAVDHRDGPGLVVAPAGAGKTRVVAERVRQLVVKGADPARVCAVSFTNNAVNEMKERLAEVADITTFKTLHALGNAICNETLGKRTLVQAGLPKVPTRWQLIRPQLADSEWKNRSSSGRYWVEQISLFRQSLVIPDLSNTPLEGTPDAQRARFLAIHDGYEAALRAQKLADFESMVLDAVRILAADWRKRYSWSGRYDYWIVDEFQDLPTPKIQLLRMLACPGRNLMVVGDDDQIIYGFAGASPLSFSKLQDSWRDIRPLPLDRNFRCPHDLVVRSQWLIDRNRQRIRKNIQPERPLTETDNVEVVFAAPPDDRSPGDENSRSATISSADPIAYEEHGVRFVEAMLAEGRAHESIALLFRTRMSAAPVELALAAKEIPFVSLAGQSLLLDPTVSWLRAWLRVVAEVATPEDFRIALLKPTRYLSNPTLDYIGQAGAAGTAIEARLEEGAAGAVGWPRKSEAQTDDMLADKLDEFLTIVRAARAVGPSPAKMLKVLRLDSEFVGDAGATESRDVLTPKAAYEVFLRVVTLFDDVTSLEAWMVPEDDEDDPDKLSPLNTEAAAAAEPGKVLLSTIHKAKGQEFEAVAVLGPPGSMPDSRASTPDEREEERRVAYVAVTRARERLLVCCSDLYGRELARSPAGLEWAAYRASLRGELPKRPPPPTLASPVGADAPVHEAEPMSLWGALKRAWRRFADGSTA